MAIGSALISVAILLIIYSSLSCYGFTSHHYHANSHVIRSTTSSLFPPSFLSASSSSTKITMPKDEEEPASKKVKREEAAAAEKGNEEEGSSADDDNNATEVLRNSDNEAYIELGSSKKRCTIRTWKKNTLVDIREFYEKNDSYLPGKKGISLTVEQYEALKGAILDGSIDREIEGLGK